MNIWWIKYPNKLVIF